MITKMMFTYKTEVPVSYARIGLFPEIKLDVQVCLSEVEQELSDAIRKQFRHDKSWNLVSPECRIDGFNGKYISADVPDQINDTRAAWEMDIHPKEFHAGIAEVAQDLACQHLAIHSGDARKSRVCAMGLYLTALGDDCVYVQKRPDNAYLYPGKLNSTGSSLPEQPSSYVSDVLKKIVHYHKLEVESDPQPLAILFDNTYNLALPMGYIMVTKIAQDTNLRRIDFSELKAFLDDNPIEDWNMPGFVATLLAAGKNGFLEADKILSATKQRLENSPINVISSWDWINHSIPEQA